MLTARISEDGLRMEFGGFVLLEGEEKGTFQPEAEGAKYELPLKARGNNGELGAKRQGTEAQPLTWPADFPENYDTLPLIKDGNKQLYVQRNGRLTADPYTDNTRRNVKRSVVTVEKQASAKRMYSQTIKDENIVWPDGNVRQIAIDIKANNPMTPEEFKAQKSQASQRRQATVAQQIVNQDSHFLIPSLIDKWKAQGKDAETISNLIETMGFTDGLAKLHGEKKYTDIPLPTA